LASSDPGVDHPQIPAAFAAEIARTTLSALKTGSIGRLLTDNEFPARLWKFGLARDGRVPVEFCEELTVEWLKEKSNWIDRQRQKVVDCFKARGYRPAPVTLCLQCFL
jgi:hypothetical protein